MKKKTKFIYFMAVLLVFAFAQMAMADTIKTVDGSGYGPYQTGSGGEFTLLPDASLAWVVNGYSTVARNQGTTPGTFQSFCIEVGETISAGVTYNAFFNSEAVAGGTGGPSPDPLSIGTADLYYNFAKGTLAGYNYTGTTSERKSSAGQLQNVIWWLEGEAGDPGAGNTFRGYIITNYGDFLAASADNNGAFNVAVLNLYTLQGGLAQDVLVVTPIPAAVWLLGSGLLGLVGIRRRFKK